MNTYAIYIVHGFCESEWEFVETQEATSEEDALRQAQGENPELVGMYLVATPSLQTVAA